MNFSAGFYFVFIFISIIILLSTVIFLFLWWRGADSVLFPGIGLVVSTQFLIVLLLILSIFSVLLAGFFKPSLISAESSQIENNLEYPNDIYSGCGNGVLDLALTKNPDEFDTKTDQHLKICINPDDLSAIQDTVVKGRIEYSNYTNETEHQRIIEHNLKLFREFSSQYPMLGRIDDIYQDYVFNFEEVSKLRAECLKLKLQNPNPEADLALRKFIFACDEALKAKYFLRFLSD